MDKEKLAAQTKKRLAETAKRKGIKGWHAMTKDQLIRALLRQSGPTGTRVAARGAAARSSSKPTAPKKRSNGKAASREAKGNGREGPSAPIACSADRDISTRGPGNVSRTTSEDTIALEVLDPYWLHVSWSVSSMSVARAEAALGKEWHGAKPILRLQDVTSGDTTGSTETPMRDISIYGGVSDWYIDVREPGRAYRIDIGYQSRKGRFFAVGRSNTVTTPRSTTSDAIEQKWSDFKNKVRKTNGAQSSSSRSIAELGRLFDGSLRVPMNGGGLSQGGNGHGGQAPWLAFDLEAELIVYGTTDPDAAVTLQGEAVDLRKDGTFTMRYSLPEGRQIIPAVAVSRDGSQELTVILAVERNTKHLEPIGPPAAKAELDEPVEPK